ncbi:DNA-binding response OmpR family regulator [Desulfitispora alkaliphila]|uniref:hypothetical protein n=1 Tax=Desulfitispora alkaliphila TaxID=622674 RepID=UPI003D1D6934
MKVIVISEDKGLISRIKAVLEREYGQVKVAAVKTVEEVLAEPVTPHIAVVDLHTQESYEVKKLRESLRGVSILGLFKQGESDKINHFIDLGGDDYLLMPFEDDQFRYRIRVTAKNQDLFQRLGMELEKARLIHESSLTKQMFQVTGWIAQC